MPIPPAPDGRGAPETASPVHPIQPSPDGHQNREEKTMTDQTANLQPEQVPEEFFARHIEPGTPYDDEPTEMVPPGWYVVAASEPVEGPDIVIKVDAAYDATGIDITGALARKIADLLDDFAQSAGEG
jgi:hypothetical protein